MYGIYFWMSLFVLRRINYDFVIPNVVYTALIIYFIEILIHIFYDFQEYY